MLRRVGVPVLAVVMAIPYYLPRISLATSATCLRRCVSPSYVIADAPLMPSERVIATTQSGDTIGMPRLGHRAIETCQARPARRVRIMHFGGLHGP